ncbi:MAG: peptide MFS transporter [Bacteroidota bacterium]|nr:peptide MFS transporter [Bacteroidota bacterium]MDE2835033.1 peptide MFS transporter [Bacteroidota bacterium]
MENSALSRQWFGHPRGLSTLFFTELWERFSYYGMRAMLVLFMTTSATIGNPGLDFGEGTAGAVYGLYTFFVYVLALPGGWIADNIWGQRKAVFVGGCIIALGHFTMAGPMVGLPDDGSFFLGLVLIVIGTGLLKPNVSTMVGDLYPEGGARRDAGFSIFYTGINLGAFLGPILAGFLGENYNWHWGFGLAGFGMVIGLIQYRLGGKHLGEAGLLKTSQTPEALLKKTRMTYLIIGAAAAVLALLGWVLVQRVALEVLAEWLGYAVIAIAILYFAYLLIFTRHTRMEKRRLGVIFWLFVLSAIFWSGFEQAGSSLNLFGRDSTDRMLGGWELPATWLQSVNALFIIILAPIFGSMWITLARLKRNPSIPLKFAMGLLGLATGFFVITWGAANAVDGSLVSPSWLVVTYFFHTVGELSLSPVGLSSITKLAPKGRVGQMMGVWFIGTALGNLFAGLVAGRLETLAPVDLFMNVAFTIGIAGVIALVLFIPIKRLMGNVD